MVGWIVGLAVGGTLWSGGASFYEASGAGIALGVGVWGVADVIRGRSERKRQLAEARAHLAARDARRAGHVDDADTALV